MYTRHARYAIQLSKRQGQNPFLTLLPEIYGFPSRISDGRDLLHVHGLFRQLRSCLQHCSWCDFILMDHSWFPSLSDFPGHSPFSNSLVSWTGLGGGVSACFSVCCCSNPAITVVVVVVVVVVFVTSSSSSTSSSTTSSCENEPITQRLFLRTVNARGLVLCYKCQSVPGRTSVW